MRFNSLYDTHFAPLRAKHQYWFGVLLLAGGIVLHGLAYINLFLTSNVTILQIVIIHVILLLSSN